MTLTIVLIFALAGFAGLLAGLLIAKPAIMFGLAAAIGIAGVVALALQTGATGSGLTFALAVIMAGLGRPIRSLIIRQACPDAGS